MPISQRMADRQAQEPPRTVRVKRTVGGLALAIAVGACGCSRAPEEIPPDVVSFTIMTYNINYGMPTPAESTQAIRQADADIVCLQETNLRWQQYLEPRLVDAYPHRRYLVPRGPRGGAGGMALLSKYALAKLTVLAPPEGGWFPAWLVEVQTPVRSVQLLCVHFRPALDDEARPGIRAFVKTAGIRKRETLHHFARLDRSRPAIIVGDFNEGDGGAGVSWLRDQGFTDALAKFDPVSPTWTWQTRWLTLRDRLDHILYSGHFRCTTARVLKRGGSDHYPVVATFHLKPAQ